MHFYDWDGYFAQFKAKLFCKCTTRLKFFLHLIFLVSFPYIGDHGRSASQNFNPLLSFYYFNQAIILRFERFKVWFGTKAAKIIIFGT